MPIIDLLYPKHCPVCLDALPPGDRLICAPCRQKIRYVKEPACYKCGKPLADETKEFCGSCAQKMPPFIRGVAYAEYGSKYIRRMLSEVKYHQDPQLLDFPCLDFAGRYRPMFERWNAEALIPVPVHRSRLKARGYNQAAEIARRMSDVLDIPVDETYLLRTGRTEAQKKLNDVERFMNLLNAFSVDGEPGRYRTVILVDDIYTTGSTLSACTKVLQNAGVPAVYTAVLAIGRDR